MAVGLLRVLVGVWRPHLRRRVARTRVGGNGYGATSVFYVSRGDNAPAEPPGAVALAPTSMTSRASSSVGEFLSRTRGFAKALFFSCDLFLKCLALAGDTPIRECQQQSQSESDPGSVRLVAVAVSCVHVGGSLRPVKRLPGLEEFCFLDFCRTPFLFF